MLNDAYKPMRVAFRPPNPKGGPANVNLKPRGQSKQSSGARLANARDKTSIYSLSQNMSMSEKEREQMRKELKERFTPGARPMPTSVQGLAALANERIEDAIARGQFRNIPRGKGKNIERDYNANSPFLDTTEYFMNKIIQKQEIVPPWIEKQQELVKAADTFRKRLRSDWRRHAARSIASRGGSLQSQIQRAQAYAAAEERNNPKKVKVEALTEIDEEGRLSQVTIKETPNQDSAASSNSAQQSTITVTEEPAAAAESLSSDSNTATPQPSAPTQETSPETTASPASAPFRDSSWEATENAYHTLAIASLNTLARSYNLMAPDLAKKPYFSLQRELNSCYADVAPQLASEISERARAPRVKVEVVGHRPGGILEKFGTEKAKVYDSKKPNYGFKQFWRDLWNQEEVKG